MTRARPVWGASAAITSRRAGWASSTSEISRATARADPALAAATAQRGGADAAAAPTELEGEVQHEPRTGHADRVAEGDGATVDVHLLRVEAELLGRGQPDRGEGLVDLDEVEVGGRDALLLAGARDGVGRLLLQAGVGAGDHTVGADLGDPGQAQLLRLGLAHHDDGRGPVGDLRGGTGRDGAVLGEGRAQAGERLGRRVAPDALVGLELDRVALALLDEHRDDLVVEEPVLPAAGRELVGARREGVLLLAGEGLLAAVRRLGQQAHGLVREGVPEPVEGHVVAHRHVAVLVAGPALLQQVRGVGHRLLPTGDDDLELARPDELVGQRDRVEPGEADLVDRQRRHAHRDARRDRRLARGDLPGAGRQDLAHDDVVDLVGGHARLVQGALDGDPAEVRSGEVLERAEQPTHRGACSGDDHGHRTVSHGNASPTSSGMCFQL
jgi:hypothetical protein